MDPLKLRNKNAMLELLKGGADFDRIEIAKGLDPDYLTKDILTVAESRGVRVEHKDKNDLEKRRGRREHEVLVGFLKPPKLWQLTELIDDIYAKNDTPFFLLINRVEYENNIGAIARTAFAAGVNGLIFQDRVEEYISDEILHVSMGTIARIPLVKMNIFECLKDLHKEGIKTFATEMSAPSYFKADLTGPAAFVLGEEGRGLSDTVSERCEYKISIPMKDGLDSLNVGVSAALFMYEKVRQDSTQS